MFSEEARWREPMEKAWLEQEIPGPLEEVRLPLMHFSEPKDRFQLLPKELEQLKPLRRVSSMKRRR